MDQRLPLKPHTQICFEGTAYRIEEVIGQGSNAIVYKGWYADRLNPEQRHYVLIKELFPYHPQGEIYRDADNTIVVTPDARAHWDVHKESFLAGNEVHLRLLKDHPDMVGDNLNSFRANGTLYSILGYSGGRSLQNALNAAGHDLRWYARMMQRLLDALEAFHKSGYLHLDISPDNIMLVGTGENERIFLIDFNSVYAMGSQTRMYLSRKAGYSAPEVELGDSDGIGMPSDLYSVAAVFYRCLMGRTLTLEESLRPKAPDGKDSACLSDQPETVVNMVGRILKKGLHTLPAKRYQSIGQMRQAFGELLDRIDCVGVTHWSLWENGKRSVEELIRMNPALRYVTETNKLYPIRLKETESKSLSRYMEETVSPEGKSSLIVARGGMGKTTLLLHTAMLLGKNYSPGTPAVFYISLNGWNGKDTQYIQNQLLMRLRFQKDMNQYDSAKHALRQLLNQPLKTRSGDAPTVLLLLDGLNEIHGDSAVLVREINELHKLAGVRIIAASRNTLPELEMQTAELIPLEVEDIEAALGKNGLLIPQKPEVLQLLRTPLILSVYIQASEAGKQLEIETEADLMRAYMNALLEKAQKQLPEDSPERWQTDVALNYVLPALAAEVRKNGRALTEQQMLKTVEKCWKTLRSPLLKRAFPQWIGHTKDILSEAETAEQWYGIIIHDILYQRLGMLNKDADGRIRVFHQTVGEYLADSFKNVAAKIRKRDFAVVLIIVAVYFLFMGIAFLIDEIETLEGSTEEISFYYWWNQDESDDELQQVVDSAYTYIQNPDELNAVKLSHCIQNAVLEINACQKNIALRYEEYPWYDPESGHMKYSYIEQQILSSLGKPAENISYLGKNYLAEVISQTGPTQYYYDYSAIILTFEVLFEHHLETGKDFALLEEYVPVMDEFLQKRKAIIQSIYDAYWGESSGFGGVEELDAELEELTDRFSAIYLSIPSQYQAESERRLSLLFETGVHQAGHNGLYLPDIPGDWNKPTWLPGNAKGTYLTIDLNTLGVDENVEADSIIPFAWYTTCYEISKEDMLAYRGALEKESFDYTYVDSATTMQATLMLDTVCVTIVWTEEKTILIVTGVLL